MRGDASSARVILAMAGLVGLLALAVALVVLDLSPGIVLALVAGGIAIPFLVMRPDIGVQLFIATIFIENIAFLTETATAIKFAGALILAGCLLSVGVNRRLNLRLGPLIVFMALFLGWNAIGIIYALDSDRAIVTVLTYLQLGVAMCMIGSVIDTVEKVRGVFRSLVVCTTIAAAHGTALYFLGVNKTSAGVVLNRNAMAAYIDLAIVLAYFLYQMSPSAGERLWLLIALPTLFLSLALTFSRTGYITVVVVLMLIGYLLAKGRGYIVLGATATMFVVITSFLPTTFYTRVESIVPSVRHQEETFGVRVDLWKAGLRMIRDHPVRGVGPGNFAVALPRYGEGLVARQVELVSHNTLVGIAAESGIPALVLFLLFCVAGIRDAMIAARALKHGSMTLGLEALALEICIVAIMITAMTGNTERQKFLYVLFGLAMSVRQMWVVSRAAGEPAVPSEPESREPSRLAALRTG